MKTDLDHLPDRKRHDLERVVQIIFAEFEDARALSTQKWKREGRIAQIILYGSYARGNWIEDHEGGYYSDYDVLVIVNDERLADPEYWHRAQDHLMREWSIAKRISAPVGMVVHSMADVNGQLSRSRPFFMDVVREGVVLYSLEEQHFEMPKPLDTAVAFSEAEQNYTRWFSMADRSLSTFRLQRSQGDDVYWRNKAVFELHQAVEQLYHCNLLTLTLYSPKSHNLEFLRNKAEDIARDLIPVWPRDTKFARRCFELLQQAYVKARYSPHYNVRAVELDWLGDRAKMLQEITKEVCEAYFGKSGSRT
jgi:predicted nucleotidyltransferase/HEPN domain-containing protein